jgi:excisionase family DNA binding protein
MPQTQPNGNHEQPVTTKQLAEHLQLSDRTIANYRAQRRIPFWRINARCIRYRLSDVEKALTKCM